jgi:predicted Zn-dependent peptidase
MILPLVLAATVALAPVQPRALDLGSTKFYVQNDDDAQLIGIQLIVSAGTARQINGQDGLAALAAQTLLFSKLDGVRLADRIAADGGSVDFAVDPGVVRFAIEALPDALPAVARDFARALAAPDTSAETVDAARAAIADRIAEEEKNPIEVGIEMLGNSYYEGGAGQPPLGTTATQATFTPADVAAFFNQHYKRGNAFATATGRIDDGTGDSVRVVLDALPPGSEPPPAIDTHAFGPAAKHVITHRDIGVPFVLVGFAAPSMGDPRFGAMLVLRALLDGIGSENGSATPTAFERPPSRSRSTAANSIRRPASP